MQVHPAVLWREAPVYVLEDHRGTAKVLGKHLEKDGHAVRLFETVKDIRRHAPKLESRSVFVIDLKLGPGSNRDGLDAISFLAHLKKAARKEYRIVALTSHDECGSEARLRGADDVLVKRDNKRDAQYLQLRLTEADRDNSVAYLNEKRAALAVSEYQELEEKLSSKGSSINWIIESIERALSWPSLPHYERLILSAIYGPIRSLEHGGSIPGSTRKHLVAGVSLLRKLPAVSADREAKLAPSIDAWLSRHLRLFPETISPWGFEDGDFSTETIVGDRP